MVEVNNYGSRDSFFTFATEKDAVAYIVELITPFADLRHERELRQSKIRPDLTIRLKALRSHWFTVEVKSFNKPFSDLCSGIAQASSYASATRVASFVAPICARNISALSWSGSSIGAALLLGAQWNVGALTFVDQNDRFRGNIVGRLIIGGMTIATFSYDEQGRPTTELRHDIEHLLTLKERFGSITQRTAR